MKVPFKKGENISIHVKTHGESHRLLEILQKYGNYKWGSGHKPLEKDYWHIHRSDTCYRISGYDNSISYSNINNRRDYVEFSDIAFPGEILFDLEPLPFDPYEPPKREDDMKKRIEPGKVIHCNTEDEAKSLLEHLEKLGYEWGGSQSRLTKKLRWSEYGSGTCYRINQDHLVSYSSKEWYEDNGYKITEFPELGLPAVIDVPFKEVPDEPDEPKQKATPTDYASMLKAMME